MKRTHTNARPLLLATETVRALYRLELAQVAGGLVKRSGVIGATCPQSSTQDTE
jgi:hypothetical protein